MGKIRILGVDFGDARTGLALSDPLGITAQPLYTVVAKNSDELSKKISNIAHENCVEKIVLGLPVNMNGTSGAREEKTRKFGNSLCKATGLDVEYIDERLTTVRATQYLNEADVRGSNRKKIIDTISAMLILQIYLDKEAAKNGGK